MDGDELLRLLVDGKDGCRRERKTRHSRSVLWQMGYPAPVDEDAQGTAIDLQGSTLRKGIERISRINKAGAADGDQSFHFTDRLGDHGV